MNFRFLPVVALALAGCQSAATPPASAQAEPEPRPTQAKPELTALDLFLQKPEVAYKWTDNSVEFAGDGLANLKLVSQTWQGRDWTHRLQIFKPTTAAFPDAAVLNISYGGGSFPETFLGQGIADISGAYAVNVFNVPNQPLFGQQEDGLVAYSFQKYLETGDPSWPLLLPMTKTVTKAMDAIQEWSLKTNGKKIERFMVTGASKRGWTAYLVAAGDKRVVGIAPVVYDNLNIPAQIQHQKQVWGETSRSAVAFSNLGLMDESATGAARGKELLAAVDPYSYLSRLTLPILSINATNDSYWPHDAQTIYRDELGKVAQLSTYYAPNSTHFLGAEIVPLAQSAASWSRLVLGKKTVPTVELKREGNTFIASASGEPISAKLWMASNATRDFRQAKWISAPIKFTKSATGVEKRILIHKTLEPFGAAFAQVEWKVEGTDSPLVLASPMWTSAGNTMVGKEF